MTEPLFGDIELGGKNYRIILESAHKRDIIDFAPRAASPGGSIIHSELGLYQPLLQSDWRHGFGFPWYEDAAGYLRTTGNVDTRHDGIAMLFTKSTSSETNAFRKEGFTTWGGRLWSWGGAGLRSFDGANWQSEYGTAIAVGRGTVTQAKGDGVATLTFSAIVPDAVERCLVVTIHLKSDRTVSSVTFNGDAMTQHATVGTTPKVLMFKLVAPDIGTHNVVITLSGTSDIVASAVPLVNVDQTTPLDAAETESGTGTAASDIVTSAANELVIDALAVNSAAVLTVGASQTDIADNAQDTLRGGVSVEAGAASVTMSWSWSGSVAYEHLSAAINAGTSQAVNFALGLGTYLFYCPDGARIRKVDAAGVHSDAGLDANATDFSWLLTHNGYVYALKDGTNRIHFDSADDLSGLMGDAAGDTAEVYVGSSSVPASKGLVMSGRLFWMKEDGIWEHGEDNIARKVLDYGNERSNLNFRSAVVHNGFLLYPVRDAIFQWNGLRETDQTPPRLTDAFPYTTYGRFDNFIQVGRFAYCTGRTNETTYTESILCFDGVGWFILMSPIADGVGTITAIGYDTILDRMWFHVSGAAETTYYIPFQSASDLPYADFPTTGTHSLISSRMDMGFRRVIKSMPSVLIEGSNLSASQYLSVYYSLDGGSWVLWGSVIADGMTELTAPAGFDSVEFNYMNLRIDFVTGSAAQSPILESFTLRFLMRPDEKYGYSYSVLVGDKLVYEGSEDSRSAAEVDADLEAARASKKPLKLTDHIGRERKVYVSAYDLQAVEEHLRTSDEFRNIEGVGNLSLVQV